MWRGFVRKFNLFIWCQPDVPMTKVASDQSSPWPEWTMGMNKVDGTVKCDMSLDSSHQEESEYIKFYHKMFLIKIISKKTWKIQWFQIICDNILINHGYNSMKLAICWETKDDQFSPYLEHPHEYLIYPTERLLSVRWRTRLRVDIVKPKLNWNLSFILLFPFFNTSSDLIFMLGLMRRL